MRTNETTTYDELETEIVETLINGGFQPLEEGSPDDSELTDIDRNVLDYYCHRRWDAWRLEAGEHKPGANTAWVTLARYSEDGLDLMAINRNGATVAEAHFTCNRHGLAWLAAVAYEA